MIMKPCLICLEPLKRHNGRPRPGCQNELCTAHRRSLYESYYIEEKDRLPNCCNACILDVLEIAGFVVLESELEKAIKQSNQVNRAI